MLRNRDIVDTFPLIGRHHPQDRTGRFAATHIERERPSKLDGQPEGLGMKTDPLPLSVPCTKSIPFHSMTDFPDARLASLYARASHGNETPHIKPGRR